MSNTETPHQRDRERTRAAIIDAATTLFGRVGLGVSLGAIATEVGISKGGLSHHFKSKEDLLVAVAEVSIQRLWDEVMAQVDIFENRPGKLMRAYIRALTGDSPAAQQIFVPTEWMLSVYENPALKHYFVADAEKWRAAFEADGLTQGAATAIRSAAESMASEIGSPYLSAEEMRAGREFLLQLTLRPEALAKA